jgi:hypothetical protein
VYLEARKALLLKLTICWMEQTATSKTYTKKKGRKYMYLTKGWYEFRRANQLKLGDKLEFQLSYPLKVLVVDIVHSNG